MTTAEWTLNTTEKQDLMKRGVCQCGGGDAFNMQRNFKLSLGI
jgi:hypothetical protein